ncbi:MAG: hypothetical protein QW372_02355 [Nitrososphaerales archaeon]
MLVIFYNRAEAIKILKGLKVIPIASDWVSGAEEAVVLLIRLANRLKL